MMYCSIDKAFENNKNYSIFTAQGDINNDNGGTSLTEIRRKVYDDDDNYDDNNTLFNFSDMSSEEPIIHNKSKKSHSYYINKFLNSMDTPDDASLSTIGSIEDNETYMHIGKCKYCRSQINKKLKKTSKPKKIKTKEPKQKFLGYNYKELLLIILISIVLFFILDIIVRVVSKKYLK